MADLDGKEASQSVKIVGADSAGLETTPVNSTNNGAMHVNLRNSSGTEIIGQQLPSNSIPVNAFHAGTIDIFGNVITGHRNNQIAVDFSKAVPGSITGTTVSGGASTSYANGQGTFSSGTATTASLVSISTQKVDYSIGHEVYAEFTASFTTPTSANSYQRIGLFDSNNGFYLGYNGTAFQINKRSGGVDGTPVAQASFNIDTLTGAATSLFTRNGTPEAIDWTKLNVFRIRFGWLGVAPIVYEVVSPDGIWVSFHKTTYPNANTVVSVQSTSLPITLQINKASADATNLIMNCGAWAAGSTKVKEISTNPHNRIRTSGWGTLLFEDSFDEPINELDFEDKWLLPLITGTATYSITSGEITLSTGTTASNAIHIDSIDLFKTQSYIPLCVSSVVTYGSSLVLNSHRFWGLGTKQPSPTVSSPMLNGIGFEILPNASLQAVVFNNGTRVFSQILVAVNDSLPHTYNICADSSSIYFMIDSEEVAIASVQHIYPEIDELPLHLHLINDSTPPGSAPLFKIHTCSINSQSQDGQPVDASLYSAELYSGYSPDPSSHDVGAGGEITSDASNQLVTRGTVLTDEGSFREDFSGNSLLTNLTGTVQFVNGISTIIGIGTLFKSEILTGDYIKKVSDNEVNYARVSEVTSDTRIELESGYAGTTATGQASTRSDWKTTTPTTGGGTISLASSIISLLPGTTNGNIAQIRRDGDYGPYNLIFNASISQRIANQTTILGFVDDPSSIGAQASFQFTGTNNTQVNCVSAFSNVSGDTQTTTVTLPSSALTSSYNIYEVDVTGKDVTFLINQKVVARHLSHVPGPYQLLDFIAKISNSNTVTATTLNLDYVFFQNVDRLEIKNDFDGDPMKVSMMGLSSTTGLPVDMNLDSNGNLIVTSLTGFGSDFAFGDVSTSATSRTLVKRTTYTEQTTNAQRSIASASANDTAAGTGARTVKITYLDQTGAGPYTETLTMNGTTGVNTVATNICFIEQIEVLTAGSTGSNVGILTLYAAINKGGGAIGTIAATDNQTFWGHHYVPTGKICNITGISSGHNGTTVGSGALFTLNSLPIGVSNAVETQISDFVRLYGQSSTFARAYSSPIKVTGPARIQIYVTPETSSATVYRSAFDFFEP